MTKAAAIKDFMDSARTFGALLAFFLATGLPVAGGAQTLDRIEAAGKIVLGYVPEARPFSFIGEDGAPAGYTVALCGDVVAEVKAQTGRADLQVEWLPLPATEAMPAVQSGRVDLMCTAIGETLSRRADVSFSIAVFPGGTGAALRSDAPAALREILSQQPVTARPIWRGSPARTFLQEKVFAAVEGTIAAEWLAGRIAEFRFASKPLSVKDFDDGITAVLDGRADVFFGSMPVLIDAASRHPRSGEIRILDRLFTFEPMALAMARGDEDFRLIVDRSLSKSYTASGFDDLFLSWFVSADPAMVTFFQQAHLPD